MIKMDVGGGGVGSVGVCPPPEGHRTSGGEMWGDSRIAM